MIKFLNKTYRVNEMGGKFYVEIKEKVFVKDKQEAVVDTNVVKVFDTEEEVNTFLPKSV